MKKQMCEWSNLFFLLCCPVVLGQTLVADNELPLVAKNAIQEMNSTIDAAKKKAVEKLKTAMKSEMQSGRLGHANQINAIILQLSDAKPDNMVALDTSDKGVVGVWKRLDGIPIRSRQTFRLNWITTGVVLGAWTERRLRSS